MRHLLFIVVAVVVTLAVACSNDVEPADFAQDCTADADCVGVPTGDPCDCDCAAGAIHRRDEAKYRSERGSCNSGCAPMCGACPSLGATCSSGRCVAAPGRLDLPPASTDAGADGESGD